MGLRYKDVKRRLQPYPVIRICEVLSMSLTTEMNSSVEYVNRFSILRRI